VKLPQAPSLDSRREVDFEAELTSRARTWVPSWSLEDDAPDFGRALLKIAARFSSEVAERLDQCGDKMMRGFLDWLAVRGEAARPARMPVVFKMADKAPAAVLAPAPVRMQADAGDASVVFETEDDVLVVPGRLEIVVATDADKDAIYLQIPGLTSIDPLEPLPTQWLLKSFAAAGSTKLQLDPEVGLVADMILEIASLQYRIDKVEKDIVTIDPALPTGGGLTAGTIARKVIAFEPFDPAARNRQKHAVYLGHLDLLNIEAEATIDVVGGQGLGPGATWAYWGKLDGKDEVDWQPLTPAKIQPGDRVRLEKPKGTVVPRELGPVKNARWIGAFTPNVSGDKPQLSVDSLELRINDNPDPACPLPDPDAGPKLAAEAMANTTPLVLGSGVFFPLGRTPRQFDAFYLGCPEAFSKPGAHVQLCFELSDPTFFSLSAVREGWYADSVLAGVGQDRALHLFSFNASQGTITKFLDREPLQPPLPGFKGNAVSAPTVPLDRMPWRLPTWSEALNVGFFNFNFNFMVATTAASRVWVWGEALFPGNQSGWRDFDALPSATPGKLVDGLVYLAGAPAQLVALQDGKLSIRATTDGSAWIRVNTPAGVVLKTISPVLSVVSGRLVSSVIDGMVGVAEDKQLYTVSIAGACVVLPPANISFEVQPVALKTVGGLTVIAARDTLAELVAVEPGNAVVSKLLPGTNPQVIKGSLEAVNDGGGLCALASVRDGADGFLASWTPLAAGAKAELFSLDVQSGIGQIGGSPTLIAKHVAVPGEHADALVAVFDPTQRMDLHADVATGIVVPATAAPLAPNDIVTMVVANAPPTVTGYGTPHGSEVFYPLNTAFGPGAIGGEILAYRYSTGGSVGTITAPDKLKLKVGERSVSVDSPLYIAVNGVGAEYQIASINTTSDPWVVRLKTNMPVAAGPATYWLPIPTNGRVAPYIRPDPSTPNGNWNAALLGQAALVFPGAHPERQTGQAYSVDGLNRPTLVVMGTDWTGPPVPGLNAEIFLDAAAGAWSHQLGDTASNPELSWEYWNGAWSKLAVDVDETLNLKSTGAIRFEIPADIAATDWAGKTSFWIRARLIGGDYGSEKVTVTTTDLGGGKTEQTVERSGDAIKPPSVLSLGISYSMRQNVMPTFVLAEDSGSMRDQSDANRTPGAIVEGFVPLAVTLGRIRAGGKPVATPAGEECPPECDCEATSATAGTPAASGASTSGAAPASPSVAPATGRALFLGCRAPLSGASVNLLFVVDRERDHTALAPLTVDALVGDHFVPIVSHDATRALGETGLLTLTFGKAPTQADLFGSESLTWLRLAPTPKNAGAASGWTPSLGGAYLNAAWASATETLTRELVGSSEGMPKLKLKLARPPVLRNTLELRVKEPLGEEERTALRNKDPKSVISDDLNLSGDWVLWRKVIDPEDEGPTERVYALDEATGEIRFGDGQHGAIPPVGTDSIVAFAYQRTEPPAKDAIDVPANSILARTQVNLVTPVGGVEAVFSADQAAGGAPPERDDRVLRYGSAKLRHRGRAVTARDFEDLALASSPEIAQARAIVRGRRTRLVVVMRGKDASPSAAQRRELGRLLLGVAPAAFAADAFSIVGPTERHLRVELRLGVDSLDHAGAVAEDVTARLEGFFDTVTGGVSRDGWPLGASPREDDIALALLDVPHLESIASIALVETLDDGTDRPWTGPLKPGELARLAEDAVRFEFDSLEAPA
jgi:hypothetical protein